mgnify:CR=1 FL=1
MQTKLTIKGQTTVPLHIRKMRATKHSENMHPIEINDTGFCVKKIGKAYEEV